MDNQQKHSNPPDNSENDMAAFFEKMFQNGAEQQPGEQTKNLNDLPPETKAFIKQNLHKMEKFVNNPLVAGFLGLSGLDLSELKKMTDDAGDGLISIKTTKKTPSGISESNVVYSNVQKTETFNKTEKLINAKNTSAQQSAKTSLKSSNPRTSSFLPSTPPSPIPSHYSPPGTGNGPDIRGIVGAAAVIGLIGWLLYQFTDII